MNNNHNIAHGGPFAKALSGVLYFAGVGCKFAWDHKGEIWDFVGNHPKATVVIGATTVATADAVQSHVTGKSLIVAPAIRSASWLYRPLALPVGESAGNGVVEFAKEGGKGVAQSIADQVHDLPNTIVKSFKWFKPEPKDKDPIVEYARSLLSSIKGGKKPLALPPVRPTITDPVAPSSTLTTLGRVAVPVALSGVAARCFLETRQNGLKTTKDKAVLGAAVAATAGAITFAVSDRALESAAKMAWASTKRLALPVTFLGISAKNLLESYREGFDKPNGKTKAAYGVASLAAAVTSVVFLK